MQLYRTCLNESIAVITSGWYVHVSVEHLLYTQYLKLVVLFGAEWLRRVTCKC